MPDACNLPIQRRLDELSGQPGFIRQNTGIINALLSPENGVNNLQTLLIAKDGKKAKYQYTYMAPNCTAPTNCAVTPVDICGPGTSNPILTNVVTVDQCLSMPPIVLTMAQYRDLCNYTPSQFTWNQILGRMDAMTRGIAASLITDLCAAAGEFADGTAQKDLKMINPVTRIPVWTADEEIKLDFEDAGITDTPWLVGGRSIRYYGKGVRSGGVNNDGVDIGDMTLMPSFYDNQVNTICAPEAGRETLLAVAPGVFFVVNYLENVGMFATDYKAGLENGTIDPLAMFQAGEEYVHGVIEDPRTGWMFDIDAVYIACDKEWHINISTKYDTILLPLQSCVDAEFTGVLKYDLCELPPLACQETT